MIKIEDTNVYGWEAAITGMRNPLNSWDRSDTNWDKYYSSRDINRCIGPNDLNLMKRLSMAGPDHGKYLRFINVNCDITAPLYWWKEFDTYKVGTVANSCSTMHKIAAKKFTLEDFSHEHLSEPAISILKNTIEALNQARDLYLGYDGFKHKWGDWEKKHYWWQMIQLLPSSYNQKRTVMLNYEVLANIYKSRKNHKLDEWREFCAWIKTLPYHEIITGEEK